MRRLLLLAMCLTPALAAAQDLSDYNRGLAAFNAGDADTAVQSFYALAERSPDPELKAKAGYYLAQSLAKKGLYAAATIYLSEIVKGGKAHPFYLKAVEALVDAQHKLGDPYLIPTFLSTQVSDDWSQLPPEVRARIDYLVATTRVRATKLDEARDLLLRVPEKSPVYAKARYLLGVVNADPRLSGGAKNEDAITAFQAVLAIKQGAAQEEFARTQQLALLGLGRTYYAMGEYHKAVEAYERIPRFSRYWDQALFENGFARFRDEDYGGALGSLQALHAPQFEGSFQPESWLLKATVYHFSCLYEESHAALKAFEDIYLPMAEKLKPLADAKDVQDFTPYFDLVAQKQGQGLPRQIYLWVKGNERVVSLFELLKKMDAEKATIAKNPAWPSSMTAELNGYLDQNRQTVVQTGGKLVKNRLDEAYRNIRKFSNDGDFIRLETTLAEKGLLEQGVDQKKILADQTLYKPAIPGEEWNYWQFQGEFWIDEIGYYQYTLKRGCPLPPSDRDEGTAAEAKPAEPPKDQMGARSAP